MESDKLINVAIVGAFDYRGKSEGRRLISSDVKTFNAAGQASHEELVALKNSKNIGAVVCFDALYPNSLSRDGVVYMGLNFDVQFLEVGEYDVVIDYTGGRWSLYVSEGYVEVGQQKYVYVARECHYDGGLNVEDILKYAEIGPNSHLNDLFETQAYAAQVMNAGGSCTELLDPVLRRLKLTSNLYLPTEQETRSLLLNYLELMADVNVSAQLLLDAIATNKWYDQNLVEHRKSIVKEVFGF